MTTQKGWWMQAIWDALRGRPPKFTCTVHDFCEHPMLVWSIAKSADAEAMQMFSIASSTTLRAARSVAFLDVGGGHLDAASASGGWRGLEWPVARVRLPGTKSQRQSEIQRKRWLTDGIGQLRVLKSEGAAEKAESAELCAICQTPSLVRCLRALAGSKAMWLFCAASSMTTCAARSTAFLDGDAFLYSNVVGRRWQRQTSAVVGATVTLVDACQIPEVVLLIASAIGIGSLLKFSVLGSVYFSATWSTAFMDGGISDIVSTKMLDQSAAVSARLYEGLDRFSALGRLVSRLLWRQPMLKTSQVLLPMPSQLLFEISDLMLRLGQAAGAVTVRQLSVASRHCNQVIHSNTRAIHTADSDLIYVCGRSWGSKELSWQDLCISPRTGQWEQLPPMLQPRAGYSVASVGGKLYAIGGMDSWSMTDKRWSLNGPCRAECFDPISRKWSFTSALHRPCTHAAVATAGGCIYLFGGLCLGRALSQAERFDPQQGGHSWEHLLDMPTARFECAAVSLAGHLHVVGGATKTGVALATVESFDPKTGFWTVLPQMQRARFGCAVAAVGGRVYVFGGCGVGSALAEVEVFDPQHCHWESAPPMPVARNHCGAASSGGKIFILGGNDNSNEVSTMDVYIPETRLWLTAGMMPMSKGTCNAVRGSL